MSEGILGGHKSTTAGTYNVYEVPTGKVAEVNISLFSDTNATNTVRLYVKPTVATSPTAVHVVQFERFTNTRSRSERPAVILKAGETVSYYTDNADTHVVVSGIEYDSSSLEFSERTLVTTNTETVLYSVPASKTSVVNCTVTLDGAAGVDTSDIKLYVSNTDAASGYIIQKESLYTSNTSGIERTGLVLTSNQKLILVTSNISGNVISRVHGKIRNSR